LPDLQLVGLDGTVTPLSAYAGRVVVLNFWATWCAPCRAEMDSLERLARSVDPRRLTVLGVSVDEDANLVREHVLRNDWTFARFIDRDRSTAHGRLRIDTLPRTFVIAPNGTTTAVVSGARDWSSASLQDVLRRAARTAAGPM
jgi:thiol-disulfide isomerase/thioredoxin